MATWANTGFKVSDTTPIGLKFTVGPMYWKTDGIKVSDNGLLVTKFTTGPTYWKMDGVKLTDNTSSVTKFTSTPNLKWGTIGNVAFQKVLVGEMKVVKDIFQFWG